MWENHDKNVQKSCLETFMHWIAKWEFKCSTSQTETIDVYQWWILHLWCDYNFQPLGRASEIFKNLIVYHMEGEK